MVSLSSQDTSANSIFDRASSLYGSARLAFGVVVVGLGLICSAATFVVLVGLTPIQPNARTANIAIWVNCIVVAALVTLIIFEVRRLLAARRNRRAAARLHIRIVMFFSIIAAVPAVIVALVAAITLDLGLDRWFELRTRSIVDSSQSVTEAYINETAINLRNATITVAFALEQRRVVFNLDRTGFRELLTQQARGRGMLGAFMMRRDGTIVMSADIETARPLPLPPEEALADAREADPVIIPPGVTNLVGAVIKFRDFDDMYLFTVRTVSAEALDAVRLMEQNRDEYQLLEDNRGNVQIAFALLYAGLTLILLLAAIWAAIAVANRLVRPIRQLIGAAQEVADGNLEIRVPVRASDGDVGYLSETFNGMLGQLKGQRDELVVARDSIDERRRFSEAVLAGVSAGVIGVGEDGCVTIANTFVEQTLGMNDTIKVGTPLSQLSEPIATLFSEIKRSGRHDIRKQIKILDKRAKERVLNVQIAIDDEITASKPGSHVTHVITIDDVTDLVEAQRSTAWADVARRIAHEIKNPLTPIQLSAERIKRRYGKNIADEDRAVFDQCLATIVRQVSDIGRMVDEFSSFARMPKPVMSVGDIRETVKEAMFLVQVSRPEVSFKHAISEEALRCNFDHRLIGQAVGNVIKNATEAIEARQLAEQGNAPKGKILVRARTASDARCIQVDVIDNGKGLPKEDRHKLLEPYMTTREKGTGLGLAIVRKIMEDHSGRLELFDAPPVDGIQSSGAMVRLTLPVAKPQTEPHNQETKEEAA